ncbi:MAG: hypothetical protein ACE5QV_00080 [Fidelibacterota bacterium]
MKCPLCGYEFDERSKGCHSGCPMNRDCNLICCPNCGYSFIGGSKILNFFKKSFKKGKKDEIGED